MKRYIRINGIDKKLELGNVASIKTQQEMIYFEKMKDGRWRLVYSKNTIPDISKVKNFEIIREE